MTMALEVPTPVKDVLVSHHHVDPVKSDIHFMLDNIPEVKNHFDVIDKIGEGTFSKVFRARVKGDKQIREYALKYLIPTSHPSRIARELRCLKEVGGYQNVITVETCILHRGHFVIVMPHIPHERFSDIMQTMGHTEAKLYILNLLIALEKVHHHRIIHRDVKPSNFLYDRHQKRYSLVDFGLAQHMSTPKKRAPLADISSQDSSVKVLPAEVTSKKREHSQDQENKLYKKRKLADEAPSSSTTEIHREPSQGSTSIPAIVRGNSCSCYGKPFVCQICLNRKAEVAPRAGTPGFRAPEVLLKYKDQTTAVDVWSVGVIFLSLLSSKYPFFRASDDMSALAEIVSLLGTKKLQQAATQLGKRLTISENKPTLDLRVLCQRLRRPSNGWSDIPDSAYDLLGKLLDPNPFLRTTAKEALGHPYFA